jgi:hypothetical protein
MHTIWILKYLTKGAQCRMFNIGIMAYVLCWVKKHAEKCIIDILRHQEIESAYCSGNLKATLAISILLY